MDSYTLRPVAEGEGTAPSLSAPRCHSPMTITWKCVGARALMEKMWAAYRAQGLLITQKDRLKNGIINSKARDV